MNVRMAASSDRRAESHVAADVTAKLRPPEVEIHVDDVRRVQEMLECDKANARARRLQRRPLRRSPVLTGSTLKLI